MKKILISKSFIRKGLMSLSLFSFFSLDLILGAHVAHHPAAHHPAAHHPAAHHPSSGVGASGGQAQADTSLTDPNAIIIPATISAANQTQIKTALNETKLLLAAIPTTNQGYPALLTNYNNLLNEAKTLPGDASVQSFMNKIISLKTSINQATSNLSDPNTIVIPTTISDANRAIIIGELNEIKISLDRMPKSNPMYTGFTTRYNNLLNESKTLTTDASVPQIKAKMDALKIDINKSVEEKKSEHLKKFIEFESIFERFLKDPANRQLAISFSASVYLLLGLDKLLAPNTNDTKLKNLSEEIKKLLNNALIIKSKKGKEAVDAAKTWCIEADKIRIKTSFKVIALMGGSTTIVVATDDSITVEGDWDLILNFSINANASNGIIFGWRSDDKSAINDKTILTENLKQVRFLKDPVIIIPAIIDTFLYPELNNIVAIPMADDKKHPNKHPFNISFNLDNTIRETPSSYGNRNLPGVAQSLQSLVVPINKIDTTKLFKGMKDSLNIFGINVAGKIFTQKQQDGIKKQLMPYVKILVSAAGPLWPKDLASSKGIDNLITELKAYEFTHKTESKQIDTVIKFLTEYKQGKFGN